MRPSNSSGALLAITAIGAVTFAGVLRKIRGSASEPSPGHEAGLETRVAALQAEMEQTSRGLAPIGHRLAALQFDAKTLSGGERPSEAALKRADLQRAAGRRLKEAEPQLAEIEAMERRGVDTTLLKRSLRSRLGLPVEEMGSRALSIEELVTATTKAKAGRAQGVGSGGVRAGRSMVGKGEHRYGISFEPISPGRAPQGFLRIDPPMRGQGPTTRYGVLVLDRALSKDEIDQLGLAPYIDSETVVGVIIQGFKDEMGGRLKGALDSLRDSEPDQWYNLFHKFSYKISPFFSDKKIEDIYKDAHRSLAQMAPSRAKGSRALSIEELMTAAAKAKAGQGRAANPSAPSSAKSRPAGEHRYGLRSRPPDYGAVPRGFLRVDPVDSVYPEQTRHGVIVYDRPLSKEEIRGYELVPYMDSDEVVEFISSRLIEEAGDDLDEVLELMADGGEGYADESFWSLTEDIRPFFSDKKTLEIFKLAREKLLGEHR